jgi:hypothetical protein
MGEGKQGSENKCKESVVFHGTPPFAESKVSKYLL